jgi:hypothetical protein
VSEERVGTAEDFAVLFGKQQPEQPEQPTDQAEAEDREQQPEAEAVKPERSEQNAINDHDALIVALGETKQARQLALARELGHVAPDDRLP